MALDGHRERSRDDGVGMVAFDVPEPHFVSQMLVRGAEVLAPLFDVREPIGRSVGVEPSIGRDAVDDDGVVGEDVEEELDVLGVESVDVLVDQGLDFWLAGSRAWSSSGHWRPFALTSAEAAVFAVPDLAPVGDAVRFRLRAIGEHVPQLGKLYLAVLLDELGDVVAPARPQGSHSIERVGVRKSERVWAWSLIGLDVPTPGISTRRAEADQNIFAEPRARRGAPSPRRFRRPGA